MKLYIQCAYLVLKNNFIFCVLKYGFTCCAVDTFKFSVDGIGISLIKVLP